MNPDGRRARGDATRARIVGSARRLFGERGYARTSLADVLADAGVTKGSLYHHFADKAEVFDAVLVAVHVEGEQHMHAAVGARRGLPALITAIEAFFEFVAETGVVQIFYRDADAVLDPARLAAIDSSYGFGDFVGYVSEAIDDGVLPAIDPPLLVAMLFGAVDYAVERVLSSEEHSNLTPARDAVLALLGGLRRDASPRRR